VPACDIHGDDDDDDDDQCCCKKAQHLLEETLYGSEWCFGVHTPVTI